MAGVEICLSTFTNALSGGYCCFGVFALYNDDILVRVIDTVLNMSLSVPAEDLTGCVAGACVAGACVDVSCKFVVDVAGSCVCVFLCVGHLIASCVTIHL